ncbi:MAG: hypothetical protein GY928_38505 [Colwellia sp.]|nr:hypothetical protein [Colwellia sp.]
MFPVPAPAAKAIDKVLPKVMLKFGINLGLGSAGELFPSISLFTEILSNWELIKNTSNILNQELFTEQKECKYYK